MARPLRVQFEGAIYHVTCRGNARNDVFLDAKDRTMFLGMLGKTIERYNWLCHAYCLMDNHYHLLVETPDANISKGMHYLNCVYTIYFNRNHDRVGHVLQGRYKSILVERDSHLLELTRYIVLNPVRAGFVKRPEEWPWSSYRATAGIEGAPPFLHTSWLLDQFDKNSERARQLYREFVANEGKTGPWEELKGGVVLGSENFLDVVKPLLDNYQQDNEYPIYQRKAARPTLKELFANIKIDDKRERNGKIYEAVRVHGYTQTEVARFLGLHYSTVSVILKQEDSNS